jgi:hypothetical protein
VRPRFAADGSIDDQTGPLLKFLDGSFGRQTENPINNQAEVRGAPQCPLQPANGVAGRARRYRRLTRIWHINPL